MGQKGAVDLGQKKTKPLLNKQVLANCMLMPHVPAQVKTNGQGNETGVAPFIKL